MPSDPMAIFAGRHALLFVRSGVLMAQPFAPDRLQIAGDAVRLGSDVNFSTTNGRAGFDASLNGTVVLRRGAQFSTGWKLREVARTGTMVKAFDDVFQPLGVSMSPDGTRLAFHRLATRGGDVWTLDRRDNVQRRFTFDPSLESGSPVWSPDGRRIAFRARRGAKWVLAEKSADGVGTDTVLGEFAYPVSPMSWSPDGAHLLFMLIEPASGWDIWLYSFGDGQATSMTNTPGLNEGFPQFSPDGKWFAYTAVSSSGAQLFVESFPQGRGKWQVPVDEAQYPRWRADGRELFFLRPPSDEGGGPWSAMVVDVRAEGTGLAFGPPRRLVDAPGIFAGVSGYSGNYIAWAVSGDGQRFFLQQPIRDAGATNGAPLVVIMNHPALLPRN